MNSSSFSNSSSLVANVSIVVGGNAMKATNLTSSLDEVDDFTSALVMDKVAPYLYGGLRIAVALWVIWTAAGASL